jgi:hypothetical protein
MFSASRTHLTLSIALQVLAGAGPCAGTTRHVPINEYLARRLTVDSFRDSHHHPHCLPFLGALCLKADITDESMQCDGELRPGESHKSLIASMRASHSSQPEHLATRISLRSSMRFLKPSVQRPSE